MHDLGGGVTSHPTAVFAIVCPLGGHTVEGLGTVVVDDELVGAIFVVAGKVSECVVVDLQILKLAFQLGWWRWGSFCSATSDLVSAHIRRTLIRVVCAFRQPSCDIDVNVRCGLFTNDISSAVRVPGQTHKSFMAVCADQKLVMAIAVGGREVSRQRFLRAEHVEISRTREVVVRHGLADPFVCLRAPDEMLPVLASLYATVVNVRIGNVGIALKSRFAIVTDEKLVVALAVAQMVQSVFAFGHRTPHTVDSTRAFTLRYLT